MKALTVKHRRWFSLREKEKRKKRTVTTVKISEVLVTVKYSSVKCVFFFFFLLGDFLQRSYYTFCSQIDNYLYVFQRRFKIFLGQKKLKLLSQR